MRKIELFLYESSNSNKILAKANYLGDFTRSNNSITIIKGSKVKKEDKTYKPNTVRNRQKLVSLYSISYDDDYLITKKDMTITSPALAAAIILGKEISTLKMWKDSEGITFNDLRDDMRVLIESNKSNTIESSIKKNSLKPTIKGNNKLSYEKLEKIKFILSRRHFEEMEREITSFNFSNVKEADTLIKDIKNNPEALFIGALMDRRINAEKAWTIPYHILNDFGTLKMNNLNNVSLDEWILYFKNNHLHIDNKGMAKVLFLGIKKVINEYEGDPSNIWVNQPKAIEIVNRLKEFYGVGEKISTMLVNILFRDFKISFSSLSGIDISPDIQVVKVFKRLGLIVSNSKSETIRVAREMNPDFPGIYDLGTWEIGRTYCKEQTPTCNECPLKAVCDYINS